MKSKKWLAILLCFGVFAMFAMGSTSDTSDSSDKTKESVSQDMEDAKKDLEKSIDDIGDSFNKSVDEAVDNAADEISNEVANSVQDALSNVTGTPSAYSSYEEIYNTYSQKMTELTPTLIDELNAEATTNTAGIEGLATIHNTKLEQLATLETEGVNEMANFLYSTGGTTTDEYTDWGNKLYEIYEQEALKLSDAYTAACASVN